MLDNGIKLLVMPPGGWFFNQGIDNGTTFHIEASTYPALETKVFDFRLANIEIIASGTATREHVRYDLRTQICARAPNQCAGAVAPLDDAGSTDKGTLRYTTPIARLDDWFKTLSHSNLEWKSAERALAAAETCVTCPQNVAWKTNCAPCVESMQRRVYRYKGDRSTPVDAQLKSCRCFGHNNELAVWLLHTVSIAKEPVPANCWNK